MRPAPDRLAKGLYWDRAWSLVEGCSRVSPGCRNCWAATQAHLRSAHPNPKIAAHNTGLTSCPGDWNGTVRTRPDLLGLPLRTRKPTVWAVWTDLFHPKVPFGFRLEAFDTMRRCATERPGHLFLILTKRAEALRLFANSVYWWGGSATERPAGLYTLGQQHPRQTRLLPSLRNVWLGVTVEEPFTRHRLAQLCVTSAAHRWVSVEPLLGPVDLWPHLESRRSDPTGRPLPHLGLEWVVCGGENARNGEVAHVPWVQALRDQCQAAAVPFFFKGWGGGQSEQLGRSLDGRQHLALPWGTP